MSKRTIVSVELSSDIVEAIESVRAVLPVSKSDIIRLAIRYYLRHAAPALPMERETVKQPKPYEDCYLHDCGSCNEAANCSKED